MIIRGRQFKWFAITTCILLSFFLLVLLLGFIFIGQVHFFVRTDGQLISTKQIIAVSTEEGIVDELKIKEGELVSRNTIVLTIVPGETQASREINMRITQKQLELSLAKNGIDDAMQSNTRELSELNLRIQNKGSDIVKLQKIIDDINTMYTKGYSTKQELDSQKKLLGNYLDELKQLNAYKQLLIYKTNKVQQKKVGSLQREVGQLQKSQYRAKVYAPSDGMVIGIKDWQSLVGQYVYKGDPLFEVVDSKHFYFKAMLKEQDLLKIKIGQTVIINLWAIPREVFPPIYGHVEYISPRAIYKESETYFPVLCSLDINTYPQKQFLKIGMNGQARIDTGKKRIIKMIFKGADVYQ